MTRTATDQVMTIGIDIGKNTFHFIGLDSKGAIVLRQMLSRGQMGERLAHLPPCVIGMEACVGAHHLSRRCLALSHEARLTTLALTYDRLYGSAAARPKELWVSAAD